MSKIFLEISTDSFFANCKRHDIPSNRPKYQSHQKTFICVSLKQLLLLDALAFPTFFFKFTPLLFYNALVKKDKESLLSLSVTSAVSKRCRRLICLFTVLFVGNNKVGAPISPSSLSINLIILPNFHAPFGKFSLKVQNFSNLLI